MDRYDEQKHVHDTPEVGGRDGDVLGLGGSAVPKMPGDPSTSNDPESVRRRRERAMSEDAASGGRSEEAGHGATGIDMGAGGTGTDLSGD